MSVAIWREKLCVTISNKLIDRQGLPEIDLFQEWSILKSTGLEIDLYHDWSVLKVIYIDLSILIYLKTDLHWNRSIFKRSIWILTRSKIGALQNDRSSIAKSILFETDPLQNIHTWNDIYSCFLGTHWLHITYWNWSISQLIYSKSDLYVNWFIAKLIYFKKNLFEIKSIYLNPDPFQNWSP